MRVRKVKINSYRVEDSQAFVKALTMRLRALKMWLFGSSSYLIVISKNSTRSPWNFVVTLFVYFFDTRDEPIQSFNNERNVCLIESIILPLLLLQASPLLRQQQQHAHHSSFTRQLIQHGFSSTSLNTCHLFKKIVMMMMMRGWPPLSISSQKNIL